MIHNLLKTAHDRIRTRWAALSIAICGLVVPAVADASEGANSHYLPGTVATMIDLVPSQPGWVIEPIYLNYSGDSGSIDNIPISGLNALKLDVESDALTLAAFRTFTQPVLGATFSVGAAVPYVWMDVKATIDTAVGTFQVKDSTSGLGDITLLPAMFAWKSGPWQYSAALSVFAPTGSYDEGDVANAGLNYWTINPWGGVSYNNAETGFNAALHGGIGFNTENSDTDYDSGTFGHLEGSVQQLLPLGPGFLTLGLEAFWVEQLEADKGQREIFGDFKGRTAGAGPVIGYLKPSSAGTLVVEARWLDEMETRNRLEGEYVWVKVVYQF